MLWFWELVRKKQERSSTFKWCQSNYLILLRYNSAKQIKQSNRTPSLSVGSPNYIYSCLGCTRKSRLTFLASHSCLGRGLLRPIRVSSVGRVGKEKTAYRRSRRRTTQEVSHPSTRHTQTSSLPSLTAGGAVCLCLVDACCGPQWMDAGKEG